MAGTHVLLVTGEYPPAAGGVGDYTNLLRSALAGQDVEVTVYAPNGSTGGGIVHYDRWGWRAARRVGGIARRSRADVVHVQYQAGAFGMHPSTNVLPWLLRNDVPVVTTFHDLRPPYLFPKASFVRRFTMLRMARASAAVIVTNPFDARALSDVDVDVVEIPIGPNLPAPSVQPAVDLGTVAFFGLPSRSKGIVELIEAIGLIDSHRRPHLLLVGGLGTPSTSNDLVSIAELQHLADTNEVHLDRTGYLSAQQASDTLAGAGVVALPFQRGSSLRSGSLLAALQSGRPVITTTPASFEALRDLATMPQLLIIPRGDTGRLWDAIETGLAASPVATALPERYSWPAIAASHAALYPSAIGLWRQSRR